MTSNISTNAHVIVTDGDQESRMSHSLNTTEAVLCDLEYSPAGTVQFQKFHTVRYVSDLLANATTTYVLFPADPAAIVAATAKIKVSAFDGVNGSNTTQYEEAVLRFAYDGTDWLAVVETDDSAHLGAGIAIDGSAAETGATIVFSGGTINVATGAAVVEMDITVVGDASG